jgi:hypothetical protein
MTDFETIKGHTRLLLKNLYTPMFCGDFKSFPCKIFVISANVFCLFDLASTSQAWGETLRGELA